MADEVSREIDQLLHDREKFSTFIKRLESERTSSSERAYHKVRADYERRLETVVGSLHSHSESLRARLQEMEGALDSLTSQRDSRQEELEEARLRRSVGEYRDDSEWTTLERSLLDSVQQVEDQLAESREEITRLGEIVSQVEGSPTAAPSPVAEPPSPPEAAPPPLAPPEPPPAAATPPPQPAAPAPGGDDFISLGDLVLGDEDGAEANSGGASFEASGLGAEPPAPQPAPASTPSQSGEPAAGGAVGDELAFLESLSLGNEGEEEGGDNFSFLEQHGRGTPQTIICPHCSAANDPAEWYCTECGEELPAE